MVFFQRICFIALSLSIFTPSRTAASSASEQVEQDKESVPRVVDSPDVLRDLGFDMSEQRIVGGTFVPSGKTYPWFVQGNGCG